MEGTEGLDRQTRGTLRLAESGVHGNTGRDGLGIPLKVDVGLKCLPFLRISPVGAWMRYDLGAMRSMTAAGLVH